MQIHPLGVLWRRLDFIIFIFSFVFVQFIYIYIYIFFTFFFCFSDSVLDVFLFFCFEGIIS